MKNRIAIANPPGHVGTAIPDTVYNTGVSSRPELLGDGQLIFYKSRNST